MNKLNLLPLLLVTACNKGSEPQDTDDNPVEEVAHGRIGGIVTDTDGTPVEGAMVATQDVTATTDAEGIYTLLDVEPSDLIVVEFSKQGYATNYEVTKLISWETVASNTSLLQIDGSSTFSSLDDASVIINNTTIDFQANSYIDLSTGEPYDGEVTVEITHVDPSTAELEGAPADLSALSFANGVAKDVYSASQLVSYGMVDVSLFGENNEDLSIDNDRPATVKIPITNGNLPGVYQMSDGDSQTTWSFDIEKGKWVEEGSGTVENIDGVLYFTFEAEHFSWWNCDQGFVPSCATGRVIDYLGFPVRGAEVICDGDQTTSTVTTDEDGDYVCSVMVGDYVSFTGTTFVGGRTWHKTKGSIFMDSEGSSSADCEPIPDIQIDVCRIAGAVNVENLDAVIDANVDGSNTVGADHLSAVFWTPPGDPLYCSNPWNSLEAGTCWHGTNEELVSNFPESAFPGIPSSARSAGNWVMISNDYHSYKMEKSEVENLPYYTWEAHAYDDGEVTTNRPDFKQHDVIDIEADGDFNTYFGPWNIDNAATIPDQVYFSADALTVDGSALSVDYENTTDGDIFFMTMVSEQQVLCKFENNGGFVVPSSALSQLGSGWGGASVFTLSVSLEAGPDGLPVYLQVFSGETVPLLVE